MSKLIIDLSEWQRPERIDYSRLAQQLSHGIIRVQFGEARVDRYYTTHLKELQKQGITVAVYAWVRGTSLGDMRSEARAFYQRARSSRSTFWWLDVEEQSMANMRLGVEAYRAELKRLGAGKVGVYLSHHLYQRFNLELAKFDAVWLPHYGVNNGKVSSQPQFACDLHQYTDQGRLAGYQGKLDLNRLIGTKPLNFFTGRGSQQGKGQPKSQATSKYIVKPGDTASQIALVFGISLAALKALNPNHSNWQLIYPGQELVVKSSVKAEKYYVVKPGDNLWDIAFRLYGDGASFNRLQALNGLSGNRIYPGQRLWY